MCAMPHLPRGKRLYEADLWISVQEYGLLGEALPVLSQLREMGGGHDCEGGKLRLQHSAADVQEHDFGLLNLSR